MILIFKEIFVNSINNNVTPKKKKVPGIIISLICAALLIYLSCFLTVPITNITGIVLFGVFCPLYSVLLSCERKLFALLPPALTIITISIMAGNVFDFGTESILAYTNTVFTLLTAVVLSLCQMKNSTKSVTFAAVSVAISAYICSLLVMLVYFVYGKADLNTIYQAINETASLFGSVYKDTLTNILGEMPEGTIDSSVIKDMAKQIEVSMKISLPATVATFAMGISALCIIIYKPVVFFTRNEDECLQKRFWFFTLTRTSAIIFEILFLAYIVITLFGNNMTLMSAFMNLISVLTVPFAYIGIRYFYLFILAKTSKKLTGAVIIIIAFVLVSLLFGAGSFFTLSALTGSSSIINSRYIIRKR